MNADIKELIGVYFLGVWTGFCITTIYNIFTT